MEYITDTLGQVLEKQVARHPDREFMVYPDRTCASRTRTSTAG